MEYQGVSIFPNIFFVASLCSFICLQAVYQLSGAVCNARLLGMATLRILLLTFTSRFVIDFLSIRKVIIFSAIATDDRHPLRSRSIHQNAANCMTIRFRYITQSRGVRKTYCARSRNDVRRLTSRSNGMPSKKIMESLRTFSAIATDDRHPLRSRSIHQNAANCMTIRFRYITQSRGVRKTYCARSRNDVRRLTSRSNGMPSKKIMESLRTFVAVESVLRHGRMFQGSDEV